MPGLDMRATLCVRSCSNTYPRDPDPISRENCYIRSELESAQATVLELFDTAESDEAAEVKLAEMAASYGLLNEESDKAREPRKVRADVLQLQLELIAWRQDHLSDASSTEQTRRDLNSRLLYDECASTSISSTDPTGSTVDSSRSASPWRT